MWQGTAGEAGEKLRAGELGIEELEHVRDELIAVQARGPLPPSLRGLLDKVERTLASAAPRAVDAAARSA